MTKIGIVTGSVAGIPSSLIREYGIKVIPFPIILGREAFRDGVDIQPKDFLEKVKKSKEFPKTASLPIGELVGAYKAFRKEGKAVLSMHMTFGMSIATQDAAQKAKEMISEAEVEIFDTKQIIGGIQLIVLEAARAIKEGKSKEEVLKISKEARKNTNLLRALPDLEYLYRGGRIGKAKVLMGSLMKVIPIIAVKNVVTPAGKAKSPTRANEKMVEIMDTNLKKRGLKGLKCIIEHVDNEKAARELKAMVKVKFRPEEITLRETSCCGIVHTGPQSWGIAYLMK
jgi:DegV family protein with EDD domain